MTKTMTRDKFTFDKRVRGYLAEAHPGWNSSQTTVFLSLIYSLESYNPYNGEPNEVVENAIASHLRNYESS